MKSDFTAEAQAAAAKLSVPAVVAGSSVVGLTLQDWVLVLTGLYILLQAGYLVWKWRKEAKSRH